MRTTGRRRVLYAILAAASAIAGPGSGASSQSYPTRPIRMIVPQAAGSTADIASRFVASELAKSLGQPVVVINMPGAGGTIGTAELARAPPDGYTIGLASQGTLVFDQAIYASAHYDSRRDFVPLALFGRAPNVMVVHPGNPASNVADVVAAANSMPRTSTFASGGSGTSQHLSGVLFARSTGVHLTHVPYRSAPQGVLAVVANEVTMGFFNTPLIIELVREGKLKALAVTSRVRSPLLPDVPTLDEEGLAGFEVNTWAGYVAPAATPPDIVATLNREMNRIFASTQAKDILLPQGYELSQPMSPAAMATLITDDLARWLPLVRSVGAKAE